MIIRALEKEWWLALPEHKGVLATNMVSHYLWWEGETQVITTCRSLRAWLRYSVREMAVCYETGVFIKSVISVSRVTLQAGWSQAPCSQACLWKALPARGPLEEQDREVRNRTAGFKTNGSSVQCQSCANSLESWWSFVVLFYLLFIKQL